MTSAVYLPHASCLGKYACGLGLQKATGRVLFSSVLCAVDEGPRAETSCNQLLINPATYLLTINSPIHVTAAKYNIGCLRTLLYI